MVTGGQGGLGSLWIPAHGRLSESWAEAGERNVPRFHQPQLLDRSTQS